MKYYKLSTIGVDRAIVGISPQTTTGNHGEISLGKIPYEGEIDFEFKLPVVILEDNAKLTSLISSTWIPYSFLLVDDELLSYLINLKVGKYQTWKIKVIQSGIIYENYNLFTLNFPKDNEYINFKKCDYYQGNLKDYKYVGKSIDITSYDNFKNTFEVVRKSGYWLKPRKIHVNLKNAVEDIFRLVIDPVSSYYVSEKVRKEMEELKFTGFVFKEVDTNKKVTISY
jgi:hypothetical protein